MARIARFKPNTTTRQALELAHRLGASTASVGGRIHLVSDRPLPNNVTLLQPRTPSRDIPNLIA